jgi:hypothetical protein
MSFNHHSHHITPQSLFCFAMDTEDMQTMKRRKEREKNQVSGFELSYGTGSKQGLGRK